MFRCELVDSNAYVLCLIGVTGTISTSIRMKVLKEVIAAVVQRKRSILIRKLTFIDATASVRLSKMLFITVHVVVHSV